NSARCCNNDRPAPGWYRSIPKPLPQREQETSMLLDDGRWTGKINLAGWRAGSGGTQPVIEPATGDALGNVGLASAGDVYEATNTAARAQREWAGTPPAERAAVLRRAGELWMQHRAEIKDWIVREAGSVPAKAALETDTASGICYEASALPTHPQGEVLRSEEHTSELQSRFDLVCRLLLEKKKNQ